MTHRPYDDPPAGRRAPPCPRAGDPRRRPGELFDESGVRDAQIEDIARAVGVNRAIIYRHFSGKEELFALTLVSYLDELETRLADGRDEQAHARRRG